MLVLSRKPGEQLRIGDDIIVTVTKSTGNRVTIGIEAPSEVRIMRGEIEQTGDRKDTSGHGGGRSLDRYADPQYAISHCVQS